MLDRPDAATAAALARLYDLDLRDDPGDLDLYLALADGSETCRRRASAVTVTSPSSECSL